jgi:hypothetical protein
MDAAVGAVAVAVPHLTRFPPALAAATAVVMAVVAVVWVTEEQALQVHLLVRGQMV